MKFIQQAYNGNNDWLAYIATIFLMFFGWQLIGIIPLVGVAYNHSENMSEFLNAANDSFMTLGINSNLYLILMIFTFFAGLVFLLIGVKFIHKRAILTVITSRSKIDWSRVMFAFCTWGAMGLVSFLIGYLVFPEDYVLNFKLVPFTILVLISFLLLPLQTSMEEVLFRGYLLQGFGTWFKRGFIALVLTAVIFGLLHSANPEVEKLGYITMVFYIGTGLLLGIFAIMDEGIELSLGFHAANNIFAAVLVTADWAAFQTEALFIDISEPQVDIVLFLPVIVLYPIIIYVFSKKYGWKNWKEKMFGVIRKPVVFDEDRFIA
ncbi:CPBP family intramembrane glutamic endopeptidase [Lutibacter holmesii]|uniref:CPBP family intramembrane glutamic endopeptidase n=1 Tax=Lutibacter holmesii TaxID=1137985 RepID=A0ABW3WSE4_9FLAO